MPHVSVHPEVLRDPFVFGPREGTAGTPSAVLMGVLLWDASNPLAIVGDQMVGLGDRVGQWEIVKIEETGIVIQQGGRQETVTTGSSLPTD
ncbi:MAG: hypothetical protein HY353_00275 [Candidatus Omnitrophica bacterium]|nr:hypothetical protein [Candidatus Omnitrophota bacterium]